jgi:hypothetical protein
MDSEELYWLDNKLVLCLKLLIAILTFAFIFPSLIFSLFPFTFFIFPIPQEPTFFDLLILLSLAVSSFLAFALQVATPAFSSRSLLICFPTPLILSVSLLTQLLVSLNATCILFPSSSFALVAHH